MKLYAPAYYKHFKCIAERCEHSCCIGWEIDIDSDTFEKYQNLTADYASAIRETISTDGTPHFRLGACDRCPHLDEQGLCKIITNIGEDYLCDICREHPRFYNYTTVAEVGLGLSCPEAARVVLSSPDFDAIEEIGELSIEADGIDFDGRTDRETIYAILQSEDYAVALEAIYRTYAIEVGEDADWLERLSSLEYLYAEHRDLFLNYASKRRPAEADESLKRFLAYLVYRHCTEAFDADDFRDRLAFCLFGERLLATLISVKSAATLEEIATLASIISEEIEYSDENTSALMNP